MSTNILRQNEILDRLLSGLEKCGLGQRGRNKKIAADTGYSEPQLSAILKGKESPNERFLKALERNYFISESWVITGEGEMFLSNDAPGVNALPDHKDIPLEHTLASCGLNPKDIRMVKEWLKMSPADQDEVLKTLSLENLDKGRY